MDNLNDPLLDNDASDGRPLRSEAELRTMLERSRRDIAEGHTVPLAPVLDRMRATAERIRREQEGHEPTDRRPA